MMQLKTVEELVVAIIKGHVSEMDESAREKHKAEQENCPLQ
jgi:hypothetical protein